MKTFRLFGIIMMLVMGMAFSACSDDDDDNGDSVRYPLTGTWIGFDEEDGEQVTAVFNGDGSGCFYEDIFDDYKIEEGTILIKWEGDDDFDFEGYIEIGDGQFRTRYDEYEDWITFYKQ